MREIKTHQVNETNERIVVRVLDEPGQGGACHEYDILVDGETNCEIHFQNGPIKEEGVNGVTQEALIAVVIDRLRSFQAGQYACRENAIALTHFETGLMWLLERTRERQRRGVEGTQQK